MIDEGEAFTVNSEDKWQFFIGWARKWYDKHHYVTFQKPRIGPDRSIDQNSLLHVWLTDYAAHLLKKDKKKVTKGELAGMKREAKKAFYLYSHEPWVVHTVINPRTGETKRDFTSSADWKRGECYMFLTWLQNHAANDGLILEAKGEYAKLQRESET